jgi:O-antigen ligase
VTGSSHRGLPATLLWAPRPEWSVALVGLCAFTFAVVTYYLPIGEAGILLGIAGVLLQKDSLRIPGFVWLFVAFLLWATVGGIFGNAPTEVLDDVTERLKIVAVVVVVINALNTERRLSFYLYFFLACFVLFPVRGTFVGYLQGNHIQGRALWNYIFNNPNDLAALSLLALGIALSIATSLKATKVARYASTVAAVALLVVIILTKSRGVTLGAMAAFLPALLGRVIEKPSRIVYALVATGLLSSVVPAEQFDRLLGVGKLTNVETIAEADVEGSAGERWEIQKTAFAIFSDNPIMGVGLSRYPEFNALYRPDLGFKDTHNTYLNLAAETGLIGLVLWIMIIVSLFQYLRSARPALQGGVLGIELVWIERALVGYLLAGLVGTYSRLTFLYLILAILWCGASLALKEASGATGSRQVRRA